MSKILEYSTVAAGWVMVPREPTPEMIAAMPYPANTIPAVGVACYRAMIAASPAAPAAAAVSAAKDKEIERLRAEVAGLQIKADLFDLAVRKGLLSVHSELIDPRNHDTRCSWLEGHAKACDISNNAALAARKGTS